MPKRINKPATFCTANSQLVIILTL